MKKYGVVRVYNGLNGSVIFESDDKQNAKDYARIMRDEDPEHEYVRIERMED